MQIIKKSKVIIICILMISSLSFLILPVGTKAQEESTFIPTWNWDHWENETFDPETAPMDKQGEAEQSQPIERWALNIEYPDINVTFQDTVAWRKYQEKFSNRTRFWELHLNYYDQNGTNMHSRYGILGFLFGTNLSIDDPNYQFNGQDLGRTEAPQSISFSGNFEECSNEDVTISSTDDNSSLLEFNVTYTNICIYDYYFSGSGLNITLESVTIESYFNMTIKFHIICTQKLLKVKIDTILDVSNVNFQKLNAKEPFKVSMHNTYELYNNDDNKVVPPIETDNNEIKEFKNGGLNVSNFDLGDSYFIKYKNESLEKRNLSSLIEYQLNWVTGKKQYNYYSFFNLADESNITQLIYDPIIKIYPEMSSNTNENNDNENISGYNLYIFLGLMGIISIYIIIKKKFLKKRSSLII
jgi:hypothetical protein